MHNCPPMHCHKGDAGAVSCGRVKAPSAPKGRQPTNGGSDAHGLCAWTRACIADAAQGAKSKVRKETPEWTG